MVKISTAVSTRKRKKRVLKETKGQFGQRSRRYKQAKSAVIKGLTYAYRDRKVKKREFRSLWIIRINAACQESGISYSRFINGLTKAKVDIDRKMISQLAIESPEAFQKLVEVSKEALSNGSQN